MTRIGLILNGFFEKSGEKTSVLIPFVRAIRFPFLLILRIQANLFGRKRSGFQSPKTYALSAVGTGSWAIAAADCSIGCTRPASHTLAKIRAIEK